MLGDLAGGGALQDEPRDVALARGELVGGFEQRVEAGGVGGSMMTAMRRDPPSMRQAPCRTTQVPLRDLIRETVRPEGRPGCSALRRARAATATTAGGSCPVGVSTGEFGEPALHARGGGLQFPSLGDDDQAGARRDRGQQDRWPRRRAGPGGPPRRGARRRRSGSACRWRRTSAARARGRDRACPRPRRTAPAAARSSPDRCPWTG